MGSDCFCFLETRFRLLKDRGDPLSTSKIKDQGLTNVLNHIDCVHSNVQVSHQEALLYVFEDNEAVIKMINKGRSPKMRYVSRTHRVDLDWLFELADMLNKGNFTRDEWNHLLCLFNISHFSSTDCSEVMSKRTQEESGEERVTAKSRPMMSLIARVPSNVSSSINFSKPGEEKSWKSRSLEYEC